MKKILFISHEASRTGAPMVLLYFLKWIQLNQAGLEVDVLVLNGGGLENEFKQSCRYLYNYNSVYRTINLKLWQRILLKFKLFKKPNLKNDLLLELEKNKYDLIYSNTVLSLPLAQELIFRCNNIRHIAHIHELNGIIKMMLPDFKRFIQVIDQFIVPSNLVKTNLVKNFEVLSNKIEVVYECSSLQTNINKETVRIENEVFTIGASGTVDWRKGYDIFIQLARYCKVNFPDLKCKFLWVGNVKNHEQIIIEEDLKKLNLTEVVEFVGEQESPSLCFENFDVFVMTSREDPFPLVCIEIGMLGKPIISFEDAVGTNEILKDGGGFIVPYLNIEAMVDRILEYYKNPLLKEKHGALNKIIFSQFSPELICPQLFSIIQKQLQ